MSARFRFFGGKGGVGKTTLSAAFALHEAAAGARTLVLSTDPAHSLGDALGMTLGPKPRRVRVSRGHLSACELDATRALERWLDPKRSTLRAIAERGTYLDREDVERFLHLSLPGVDELVGLLELIRLAREGDFESVVVDTAPTGHTLRLLAMPKTLRSMARVFDDMQQKHRVMTETIRGRYAADAADALISEIEREGDALQTILSDRERSELHWVLLPEMLPVAETRQAIRALHAESIPIAELVVNRVTAPPPSRCVLCDGRRANERVAIETLLEMAEKEALPVRFIPAEEKEPQGRAALLRVAKALTVRDRGSRLVRGRLEMKSSARRSASHRAPPRAFGLSVPDGLRLILFGGKGGVGKTTCSAAAALELARENAKRSVLLLSTDPARRMGDALEQRLSDGDQRLPSAPANLRVRELDADAAFARERERYRAAVDELFDGLRGNSNFDAAYDRAVVRDLIDLAPPGLDELFSLFAVVDALFPPPGAAATSTRYDLVIADTAPTGHALRLLDTPKIALEWTHALMQVLVKYRGVINLGKLAEDLLTLARQLKQLQALLADASQSRFVVVTRPARLPRVESERLLRALDERHVAHGTLLFNAMTPPGCARCRRVARVEQREVTALLRAARLRGRSATAIFAPALPTPPRGVAALERFRASWSDAPPT